MKKSLLGLAMAATFVLGMATAWAVPELPRGSQVQFKFSNFEVAPIPFTEGTGQADGTEDNWGIFVVTNIQARDSSGVRDIPLGGQITGMFWGLDINNVVQSGGEFDFNLNAAAGPGGTPAGLVLWFDDPASGTFTDSNDGLTLGPGGRTGDNTFTAFTDGTLLAAATFRPGILNDASTAVNGDLTSLTQPVTGDASGYLDVNPAAGLWGSLFDSDGFATQFGDPADFFLQNDFRAPTQFGGVEGDPGFGFNLLSEDPVLAFTTSVPEPGTFLFMGTSLFGLGLAGFFLRRREA